MSLSLQILEKVKDFLIRLVKDESFRAQLMSDKVEEVRKVMADSGYNFSQEEFETAAIKILDLKESGEFHELSEEELIAAVGGRGWRRRFPKDSIVQPMYGVVIEPPEREDPKPKPIPEPSPQPMYGVVIEPIDIQPMYGVIVETDV